MSDTELEDRDLRSQVLDLVNDARRGKRGLVKRLAALPIPADPQCEDNSIRCSGGPCIRRRNHAGEHRNGYLRWGG